jgi:acyl-CoA thioester hydrolase
MGKLISRIESKIRFSEVDSMRVVWHGNYLKYLEDGREDFGIKYELGYYNVFEFGLMTPIVKLDIDYKRMIKYGEKIIIETEYIQTNAAKIIFHYRIMNAETNEIAVTAKSIQVFIDKNGELQLTNPDFYTQWQEKWAQLK